MERQKIIKFLKNPKSYSHPVKKVRHLETYISDVFLTGRFAYKIKKPVNYGYLNFTTLAKRKFFCFQELKLNRRLSPTMYLDVLPITTETCDLRSSEKNRDSEKFQRFSDREVSSEHQCLQGLKFGGQGKIVEYVLKMKEMPQPYLMYRQLRKGKVGKKIIDQIAKIIARFHQKAKTSKKISFYGSLKIIKKNWQENFDQTKPFIGKTISKKDFYFLKKSVEEFINKNKKLFQQRIKEKKIRDCHGDLHTGNIFITPNKIYIFDCIEFNERFRYQDVASEIAFLSMDLDSLDRQDLSDYFVKKYIKYSNDKNLKKLLLFYKCYRVYVKGKVCSFHFVNKNLSLTKKNVYKKIASQAFKLATNYAKEWQKTVTTETQKKIETQKPILVIGAGLPGIGRSTRLKLLAKKNGAEILDSDIIRRKIKKTNYDEKSKLFVYQKMIKMAEIFLKQGQSVILDATFSKEKYRELIRGLVKKMNIRHYFLEFFCSDKVAKQRFKERAKEKNPVSQANWQIYQKIKKEFEPINEKNHLKINAAKLPVENVKKILEKIVQITA